MKTTIVTQDGAGEKRWFLGGGVHTWKVTAEETNGAFLVYEDTLTKGKTTPLHRHAGEDEMIYVIDGEIMVHTPGVEDRRIGTGGVVVNPRGVVHAFQVVSDVARLLVVQTPGTGEAFYRGASVPITEGECPVDFRRLAEVAKETGLTEIIGPPPFKR